MKTRTHSVAIIGAGIAGAALAHLLRTEHPGLVVLEKARGPGGRMSCRRTASGEFNHGASGFCADSRESLPEPFRRMMPYGPDAETLSKPANHYAKQLLEGTEVRYGACVHRLQREGQHWRLLDEQDESMLLASAVLVTAPAPQAAQLLCVAQPDWASSLATLPMDPRWVVLARIASTDADNAHPGRSAGAWTTRQPLASSPDCVVIESSREWARAHLELEPEAVVEDALRSLAIEPTAVQEASAHRWRFADCPAPLALPGFWHPSTRIGAAGDAFTATNRDQGVLRALASAYWLALSAGGSA
jgi:renalase